MDWIKVKVKHAEYEFADASDSVFRAWIMVMMLVAGLEAIPSEEQIKARIGKKKFNNLMQYLDKHESFSVHSDDKSKTSLSHIIEKVMEDVASVIRKRHKESEYMAEYRRKTLHKPLQSVCVSNGVREEIRLDKIREEKNKTRGAFAPPLIDEVIAYRAEVGKGVDPQYFLDFYEARGWMTGKNKMKDWRAAYRTTAKWDQSIKNQEKEKEDERRKLIERLRNRV